MFEALEEAIATQPVGWMAETTVRNPRLIRETRERRNEELGWDQEVESELARAAAPAQS